MNADKLPPSLSNLAGLTTADLPQGTQVFLNKEGTLCCDCGGKDPAPAALSQLLAEIAQVSAEVEQERETWDINGPVVSPGFQ